MNNTNIHFRAEFDIKEREIEEYNRLVKEMSMMVKANEPETLTYKFYLNQNNTKCIVRETYSNSDAVFAHAYDVASQRVLPKIFNVAKISKFDVYGKPSEKLRRVLTNFSLGIYNLFTG
jgi:quinol monooxygenase YgiN